MFAVEVSVLVVFSCSNRGKLLFSDHVEDQNICSFFAFEAGEIVVHRPCLGSSGSYDQNIHSFSHLKRRKLFPDHVEDLQEATIETFVVF